MSIRKLRAGRVPSVTAEQFVGEKGTIFWNDLTGEFRLSNGTTPGGSRVGFPIASSTEVGGLKLGPGTLLNNDNQLIIDSTGLSFNFGDFQATTPGNGAATLSSIQPDQDIAIVSNGTGVINMVGDFHIHRTADYDPDTPDVDGAVFAVKSDGQIIMKVPLSDVTAGALEIVGNDTGLFVSPNQTGVILHVTGNSGLVSRNYFDANANYALLVGRRYNGTQSAIAKVLSGEMFFRVAGQASTDTGFETFGPCQIDWVATEDQSPNHQGGELRFRATPNGTNAQTGGIIVATINATTGLTATKFNGPLTGNVTGKADTAGNADTVTNGVYTNGNYANPAWITSLAASKVGLGNVTNESKATMFTSPTFTGTVAGVTATMVGLGNVTNESKATMFSSPTFTGTVSGVTKSMVGLGSVENTALSTSTHYIGTTSITYNRASASQTLTGVSIDGNAGTVTNGVYTTDTSTVTNTMLAGSIANNKLANSSVTVNGTSIALGASATVTAAAGTLTGTTLNSTVVTSSLTSVGTLTNLAIASGGTITTPRVVINDGGIRTVSGGTTCTIDFATDSYILWTAPSGTAAITLSNYTAGARVKLMIALTTSRDVTYGISATANSSTGADNWNGAGAGSVDISNTTMFLDYVCMSGVAGGCYLAVTVN